MNVKSSESWVNRGVEDSHSSFQDLYRSQIVDQVDHLGQSSANHLLILKDLESQENSPHVFY